MKRQTAKTFKHYRSVVDSTTDYVFVKDLEGCYVEANPAYLSALGRTAGEVIGKRDTDLLPREVACSRAAHERTVRLSGDTRETEATLVMDGRRRHLLERRSPWRDSSGSILGVVTVATDITERKQAENEHERLMRELRFANERTTRLLDEQVRLNRRAAALLDLARHLSGSLEVRAVYRAALETIEQQLDGTHAAFASIDGTADTLVMHAFGPRSDFFRDVPAGFAAREASFGQDVLRGLGTACHHIDPRRFHVDAILAVSGLRAMTLVPIAPDIAARGVLIVGWTSARDPLPEDLWFLENAALQTEQAVRNVSLYGELNESLASLNRVHDQMARSQKLRALGEMASGVAHDFNNSLTTIVGITEWLLHTLPSEASVRPDLESIRTAAMDAADFVRRLQSFGRLSPSAETREPVDLGEIARAAIDLARPRWSALSQRRGVQFEVVADTCRVPPIRAVASEIREILLNLLFNAVDAMPYGGEIAVQTRATAERVYVSVKDAGEGMSEEVKTHIFEPFFTTKGKDGAGLGLSMCWSIAERYNGSLDVESTLSKGSTFTLSFPIAHTDDGPVVCEEPRPPACGMLRVLLLDDQAEVLETVAEMLAALGHQVTTASDVETALGLARRSCFELIITDLGMPVMNGIEVAREMRRMQPALPIVLLTGWGADYETETPEEVSLVLSKPVTMRSLEDALGRVMTGVAAVAGASECSS